MNEQPKGKNTDIGLLPKNVDTEMGDYFKQIEAEMRGVEYIDFDKAFVIRVDGRAFHTFTRGMDRPYCQHLDGMREVAATAVLKSLKPSFAYYQSDEISYVWMPNDRPEQIHPFHGRVDKLISLCASLTSVAFYRQYIVRGTAAGLEGGALPHFDGRLAGVFSDPLEAVRCVTWRENDAMRNSVQMLAQSMFSHKQLQKKNVYDQFLMCTEAGTDWQTDVPSQYQRGTYIRMGVQEIELTEEQRTKIPEAHRPPAGTLVPRSVVKKLFFGDWDIQNRLEALVG